MSSYDIRFWDITKRSDGRSRPYRVRWAVAGREHEDYFTTKALANSSRTALMHAARAGEAFDEATGLPESQLRKRTERSWFEHACAYAEMKWPSAAAKSRRATAEALATVTPALVSTTREAPVPDVLRRALYMWAYNPGSRGKVMPTDIARAVRWVEGASVAVSALAAPAMVRTALDACARTIDGGPAAATTVRRKRAVLYNALGFAVELELLDSNPIDKVQWKAPEVAVNVDRRVVANPKQAEALLAGLEAQGERGRRLVAFFGCIYYAALRPAEALALRKDNCVLPGRGWGRINVSHSSPRAGADWTDDGSPREQRGLKHRGQRETRSVPIPPELVRLLQAHIEQYGVAQDGRLFRTGTGGAIQDSTYADVWRHVRKAVLTPEQAESPLARRPYDLRHAAISLWLNAGVPATEVARRAGHGVAVMLAVYANCIDGQDDAVNGRIEHALTGDPYRAKLDGASGSEVGLGASQRAHDGQTSYSETGPAGKTAGQEGSHSGLVRRS